MEVYYVAKALFITHAPWERATYIGRNRLIMLIVKIYLYHLFFRLQWLKEKLMHNKKIDRINTDSANNLFSYYESVAGDIPYKERMRNREYKVYSQNGEDGLLLHIFSQIGITNKTFIEFGVETGRECNTANLIISYGWNGLMMDGSSKNIESAIEYYRGLGRINTRNTQFTQCFVTKDIINEVIGNHDLTGEIDLLSIDIDGNDYWIWETITVVNPRVVVIEYNASFGGERSLTVSYNPDFTRFSKHRSGWYYGASLPALEKLGRKKGYKLVCADSNGCNAFFVRDDVLEGDLQEISASEAFYPQPKRQTIASLEQQFELIKHLDITEV